jgi:precorrin-6A synthase
VWGDPSLYDSTIRVVDAVAASLDAQVEVVAGVSAPQLLAARHGIVLHEVGSPVHVTTQRRQSADVAAGERNLVVMLTSGVALEGLDDWSIWWGANLGTPSERLVAGRVVDVAASIKTARDEARAEAGWVMDLYLVRAPG